MPPTTDSLPPAMSTRFQSQPLPPIPPPTAPKSTLNARRKKKCVLTHRQKPYPIKEKDQATDPVLTPDGKEEDKEEEDSALIDAAAIFAIVKTATSSGLDPSFSLDIEDVTTVTVLSYKEMRK